VLIWSPIAVLAIVGLVSLFRSRPRDRPFLTAACAMAVGLLLFYSVTPWYSGGFGFGQRFLTALMPIVALGVAGAIAAWPRIATAAAVLCTAWTVFLMLNFVTLGVPMMSKGGASGLARVPFKTHISPGAYLWGVRYKSNFLHWTVR
jgi:apolipoprotein N-acyltransferase